MAFFDEVSKRVNSLSKSAQKTADVAKIQHQINQKQSEFDTLYHQIGQLYYSCRQRNVCPDETIDALCDRVTKIAQEIDQLRMKVDEIRNVRRCPECGKVVDRSARFCSDCGAKFEETVTEESPKEESAPAEEAGEEKPEEEKGIYIRWPKPEKVTETAEKVAAGVTKAAEQVAKKVAEMAEELKREEKPAEEEAPAEEAPAEETPVEETSVEEAPAEEVTAEEAPVEEPAETEKPE